MKRIGFLLFFVLFPVFFTDWIPAEEPPLIKLRASRHHEFVRVVLEGPEAVISKGIVNQRGQDIFINFQGHKFSMEDTELPFTYKTAGNSVVFSPGEFRQFKTSLLKSPPRLVIDIYSVRNIVYNSTGEIKDKIKPLKTKTIILDPGHGGYEYGVTKGIYREKDTVLDIAKRLKYLIGRGTAQCSLTRDGDNFISIEERANFSNSKNGEIFLSLHIGKHKGIVIYTPVTGGHTSPDAEIEGQEAFTKKTLALGDAIQTAIKQNLGDDMVSIKPLPYSILSRIEAAALIIELPSFEHVNYSREFERELADIILKGIYIYEGVTAG